MTNPLPAAYRLLARRTRRKGSDKPRCKCGRVGKYTDGIQYFCEVCLGDSKVSLTMTRPRLCPVCGAHVKNWREVFGKEHTCVEPTETWEHDREVKGE